jgi:ATP-dependent RNA helicase DDX54/DBP10
MCIVTFHSCAVRDTDKAAALLWLLREGLPKKSPTLVFASTRHHVEFLTLLLSLEGVEVCAVHGTMDQTARKISVAKFRAGKVGRAGFACVLPGTTAVPLLYGGIGHCISSYIVDHQPAIK